jgi:DNA-binding response OmpR family regulator
MDTETTVQPVPENTKRHRVLLLHDPMICGVVSSMLARQKITCDFTYTTEEALSALERRHGTDSPYNLVISDDEPSNLGIYEFARQMKAKYGNQYPLMILACHSSLDDEARGSLKKTLDRVSFLEIPASLEDMVHAVHSALGR